MSSVKIVYAIAGVHQQHAAPNHHQWRRPPQRAVAASASTSSTSSVAAHCELRSSTSLPTIVQHSQHGLAQSRASDTSSVFDDAEPRYAKPPPRYSLVERRTTGGSIGKLPRLPPPSDATRRRERPHEQTLSETRRLERRGEAQAARRQQTHDAASPPEWMMQAALPTAHAAAAMAAVEAVAKAKADAARSRMQASVKQIMAIRAMNNAKVQAKLTTSASAANAEFRLRNRRSEVIEQTKSAVDAPVQVATSIAMRKWPDLSPRSAVEKEETIQRLASLPVGMHFAPECSAADTTRILQGL